MGKMKKIKIRLIASLCLFAAFVLWTGAICCVDVQEIGPKNSAVGFAGINGFVHKLTGVHWGLYILTDWLSLVPIILCLSFGALGLSQWIRRKSVKKVDPDILVLGGFYLITIAVYGLFECFDPWNCFARCGRGDPAGDPSAEAADVPAVLRHRGHHAVERGRGIPRSGDDADV